MSDENEKMQIIRARVSKKMKADLVKLAHIRGEAEAVLIREALRAYIAQNAPKIAKRHSPEGAGSIKMLPVAAGQ